MRLIALSPRACFPSEAEQMLLRVAANQAAIAIERSKSEAQLAEQTRALERLNETETALFTFTNQLFRAGRATIFTRQVSMLFSACFVATVRRSFCSTIVM